MIHPATETAPPAPDYAGFWLRFGAAILDWIIVGIISFVLNMGYILLFGEQRYTWQEGVYISDSNIPGFIFGWLYYAGLESSRYQATLGKQMVGIYVTHENGRRISFLRATGRYFAKIISAAILFIGYIMAAFTARKQALHDLMASTLVLKKSSSEKAIY